MKKGFIYLGAIVTISLMAVTLAAAVYVLSYQLAPKITQCTLEAKLCPDGSAVGRTGPNCEFSPCQQDETANWQTYRNEEYGFEVKYPTKWIQDKCDSSTSIVCLRDPTVEGPGSFVGMNIFLQKELPFGTPTTVAARAALITDNRAPDGVLYRLVYFVDNPKLGINFADGSKDVLDRILSAFKFISQEQGDSPKNGAKCEMFFSHCDCGYTCVEITTPRQLIKDCARECSPSEINSYRPNCGYKDSICIDLNEI